MARLTSDDAESDWSVRSTPLGTATASLASADDDDVDDVDDAVPAVKSAKSATGSGSERGRRTTDNSGTVCRASVGVGIPNKRNNGAIIRYLFEFSLHFSCIFVGPIPF